MIPLNPYACSPLHAGIWCSLIMRTSWRSRERQPAPAAAAMTTAAAAMAAAAASGTTLCGTGCTMVSVIKPDGRCCGMQAAGCPAFACPAPAACCSPPGLPTSVHSLMPAAALLSGCRLCECGQREDEQEPGQLLHHPVRWQGWHAPPASPGLLMQVFMPGLWCLGMQAVA